MEARDLQLEAMRLYRALTDQREHWGGKLVLVVGSECVHSGVPPAVSIAGGTTLALDSDATAIKAALRAGYLDFVVNSLDEALRALKNEVRQKRPLSVGLIADVDETFAEMAERGVQPDLRLTSESVAQVSSSGDEYFFAAKDTAALREVDIALAAVVPAEDLIRSWIERVPQFLREARTGGRWVWLDDGELTALTEQGIRPAQRP